MVENKLKSISVSRDGRSTYLDMTGVPRGHGGSNFNRGNNNNQRMDNRGGRGGNQNSNKPNKSSFDGACADLESCIFNVRSGQILLYNNTLTNILNYAGKNYTPCVQKSTVGINDMSHYYIVQPFEATGTITRIEQITFEQEIKDYVKEMR